jgi:hypothetical protein
MRSSMSLKDGAISEEMLNIAWEIVHARNTGGTRRAYGTGVPGPERAGTGMDSGSQADRGPGGITSADGRTRTRA